MYLGVYDLELTYQRLHEAFAEDRDAYDERRAGLSACAGVLVDNEGILSADSVVLSSALWAVGTLTAGIVPRGTNWALEFDTAAASLIERLDAIDGARREAICSESPPAQDGDSMPAMLAAAHTAAGIAADSDLASQRIIIQSDVVIDSGDDAVAPGIDFLNSFFLDDLSAVHSDVEANGPIGALATYLTPDGAVPTDARVDLMVNQAVVDNGVSIGRLPKGRWPSDPSHGLALRQQFAVNQALGQLLGADGLMSVNGPPGTGKTTMLRDVLAGNVVERAGRLASLDTPADAFVGEPHRWTSGDYPRKVPQLRNDLTGFEMVVASANNAAVENVTAEIPGRAAIAELWRDKADYFADIATATLKAKGWEDDEADVVNPLASWGLVAAKLGNKSNRGEFRSEFWFDKVNPRTKKRLPGTARRMQSRLIQWRDGEVPTRPWSDAQRAFQKAERRVDELIEARRAAEDRLGKIDATIRKEAAATKHAEKLEAELGLVAEAARDHAGEVESAASAIVEATEDLGRHIATRPSALETLFSLGRAARDWRSALERLEGTVVKARMRQRAAQERALQLEDARVRLAAEFTGNETIRARISVELATLRKHLAADRDQYGATYPGEQWVGRKRELSAPWLDPQIDAARSELFLAALRLHEDFLANTAGEIIDGLRAATEVVAGVHANELAPEKVLAAWQLFFLVVPMVSTTFASFARMFKGMGRQSLGWVFIDEAGQACPQYAAGAIWRARRVIAVGDPMQLQPVVTAPAKAQRDIAAAFGVSATWIPPRSSVQTLADRVSRYGTVLSHGETSVWISAPLTVHRRCDDPMFSLCNDIAYNGIMVSGVNRHSDDFDCREGLWAPASQWLDEGATTTGTHLQPNQISRLRREIETLNREGIAAGDMIAISPFREVAAELSGVGRSYPGLRAGTIHTAQGREADVVFLVLGGDPSAPGAKAWAASTVNLVNVAASRAKRRLYVIGDQSAWAKHNYFAQLSVALNEHSQH